MKTMIQVHLLSNFLSKNNSFLGMNDTPSTLSYMQKSVFLFMIISTLSEPNTYWTSVTHNSLHCFLIDKNFEVPFKFPALFCSTENCKQRIKTKENPAI